MLVKKRLKRKKRLANGATTFFVGIGRFARRASVFLFFLFRVLIPFQYRVLLGDYCLIGFCHLGDIIISMSFFQQEMAEKWLMSRKKRRTVVAWGSRKLKTLMPFYPQIKRVISIPESLNSYVCEHSHRLLPFCNKHQNAWFVYAGQPPYDHPPFSSSYTLLDKMRTVWGLSAGKPSRILRPLVPPVAIMPTVDSKSVLIIPFSDCYESQSIRRTLVSQASFYLKRGYTVYVNGFCRDFDSACVFVFWDLVTLWWATKKMAKVIAIRTGLLDYLADCGVSIVVYHDDTQTGKFLQTVFDLSMWHCSPEPTNIVISH